MNRAVYAICAVMALYLAGHVAVAIMGARTSLIAVCLLAAAVCLYLAYRTAKQEPKR